VDDDQRDQRLGLASCYPTFMFGCLILQVFGNISLNQLSENDFIVAAKVNTLQS